MAVASAISLISVAMLKETYQRNLHEEAPG
jgi:hypothetical protein